MRAWFLVAAALGATSTAFAIEPSPWTACHVQLRPAADRHGVPFQILEAVAAAESGRYGNGFLWPWPWTVNVEGKARFFSTRVEAAEHARRAIETGTLNVDVGCMQLNWRYHGAAFGDLDRALEPQVNVDYAARLLAEERRHGGSWSEAVSRYHSRNPHLAANYRCLVAKRLNATRISEDCEHKTGTVAPASARGR